MFSSFNLLNNIIRFFLAIYNNCIIHGAEIQKIIIFLEQVHQIRGPEKFFKFSNRNIETILDFIKVLLVLFIFSEFAQCTIQE